MSSSQQREETILQFGAGNFLRAFFDRFVQEANDVGQNIGKVVVAQSTAGDRARQIAASGGRFHVVVRGQESGETINRVETVASISRALMVAEDWEMLRDVIRSPHLKAVVSNTTEAGFALDSADENYAPDTAPRSFPARLLALLADRFDAYLPGVVVLPCELLDNNGDRLLHLLREQANLWHFPERRPGFRYWLENNCVFPNTLVDGIVSGKPEQHPLLENDPLLTVAEPFRFFAIEDRPGARLLSHPDIHYVPDVTPFALRKVRILNGAHTALVAKCRAERPDLQYVREAVADETLGPWLRDLLFTEIVPTLEGRVENPADFAERTLERFANPFLDHRLSAIALHHDAKVTVRLIPTRDEFIEKFGKRPKRLDTVIGG